jgi:hypothetical protein
MFKFDVYSQSFFSYVSNELHVLDESLEAMSAAITSYSLATAPTPGEPSWPYVTVPSDEFDAHSTHVTSLSLEHVMWTAPIVKDLKSWENYTGSLITISNVRTHPTPFMYGSDGKIPITGAGPFTPIHQIYRSPYHVATVNESIVNFDTSSDAGIKEAIDSATNLRKYVLSRLLPLPIVRDTYSHIFDATEPLSIAVEPVFMSFLNNSNIVAYIHTIFEWKFFFSSFKGEEGSIMCYVENTCGDHFSFLVDTNMTTFFGTEDVHEARFDDVSVTLTIGLDDAGDSYTEHVRGAGLCIFTLTVYPTAEFRQAYNSYSGLFATIVAVTMLVMVGSFFAFDQ